MSYERILIVGNLGNAPELRTSAKDAQSVVTLSVAVNRKRGDQRTVTWYREHESWWRPLKDGSYREYYRKQYENR